MTTARLSAVLTAIALLGGPALGAEKSCRPDEAGRIPAANPCLRLTGRALAALQLVTLCREPDFSGLGILDVDISKQDYLLAVLGNYQRAKIAWDGMDEPNSTNRRKLVETMSDLRDAVNSAIAARAIIWNATQPGRPTADTKEPIL